VGRASFAKVRQSPGAIVPGTFNQTFGIGTLPVFEIKTFRSNVAEPPER
jgi:hypothetical protein